MSKLNQQSDHSQHDLNMPKLFLSLMGPGLFVLVLGVVVLIMTSEFTTNQMTALIGLLIIVFAISFFQVYRMVYSGMEKLFLHVEKIKTSKAVDMKARFGTKESGLFVPIFNIFNEQRQQIDDLLTELYASSARLSPMADELNTTYHTMQQKSTMQEQLGNDLNSAFGQVYEGSMELNHDLEQISEELNKSNGIVKNAHKISSNSSRSIERLTQHINDASSHIEQLQKDSNQINDIIDVITSIADQTNLLALNAAIEAARAGEQGRGFAVVADEVRTLAEKTGASTQEVRDMIARIQEGTKSVSESMEIGTKASAETIELSNAASTELNHVLESIQSINKLSENLLQSATKQSEISSNARQQIANMVELNHEVLESERTQELTSEDLRKLSDKLKSLLDSFSFNDAHWDDAVRPKRTRPVTSKEADIDLF